MVDYVTFRKYAEMSGISVDAMNSYIKTGTWAEGVHYCFTPKGRKMAIIKGIEQWIMGR